uniref:Transposon Ty3-I Gag-Pol polyprotein n=1 Tax=Cajanus cajan TaxID=3821 RepID=A0A151TZ81_CAJCA|nr:Transposon Ty3-I Gag-Pol polyprotein [Cajanus cajan]
MCTDYTDLNKACPKDAYPLLCIDRLVDVASGHSIFCFLDAYSGYNQIKMHPADEEKTAFITENANFCYKVMSFGLKNAGATYQRLMDKVFQEQIGRNIEIYVDDMVVKSNSLADHIADLAEIFGEVRKHNMRLNPEKCTFEVKGGKFLGFMLSARGIEANRDKFQVVLDMRSPSNLKELQRLSGRLVALSRFLPRLVDKINPMTKLL